MGCDFFLPKKGCGEEGNIDDRPPGILTAGGKTRKNPCSHRKKPPTECDVTDETHNIQKGPPSRGSDLQDDESDEITENSEEFSFSNRTAAGDARTMGKKIPIYNFKIYG